MSNTPAHQRARALFAQCEEAANCHRDNAAEAAECVIQVIAAALEEEIENCAKVAQDYKSGDSIANPSDIYRRIAAAIRQRKGAR